jgi:hypothetical protein
MIYWKGRRIKRIVAYLNAGYSPTIFLNDLRSYTRYFSEASRDLNLTYLRSENETAVDTSLSTGTLYKTICLSTATLPLKLLMCRLSAI